MTDAGPDHQLTGPPQRPPPPLNVSPCAHKTALRPSTLQRAPRHCPSASSWSWWPDCRPPRPSWPSRPGCPKAPDRRGAARRDRPQPHRVAPARDAARLAVRYESGEAARALGEAERLARQPLDEVRATVGLLRTDRDASWPRPSPELLSRWR